MSIERIIIPEGVQITEPANLQQSLGEILLSGMCEVEHLDPGEYIVTPKQWTKSLFHHELIVLDNGEAVYRVRPRDQNAGYIETSAGVIVHFNRGGKEERINANKRVAMIGGGHPGKPGIYLFGVVRYID